MKYKLCVLFFIMVMSVFSMPACSDFNQQEESLVKKGTEETESPALKNEEGQDMKLSATSTEVSDEMAVIPYAGEAFTKSVFTAGGDMLYVCGIRTNGDFFLGYMQKEEDVFQEFGLDMDEQMRAFNMTVDEQGFCHILWMSVEKLIINGQSFDSITYEKSYITVVKKNGELEKEIDVTNVFSSEQRRPFCFVVDKEGNYYFENDKNLIQILSDGTQGETIPCEGWIEGVGMGKSGTIYCTYTTGGGARKLASLGENGILSGDVLLPEADANYSEIYPGTDVELLLFNKNSGISVYDNNEAEVRVPGAEMPVSEQMIAGQGALADGRICILAEESEGYVFYYIPSVK